MKNTSYDDCITNSGMRTLCAEGKAEETRDADKNRLMWLCKTRADVPAAPRPTHATASDMLSNTDPFSPLLQAMTLGCLGK